MAYTQIVVTGTYHDYSGEPLSGHVVFTPTIPECRDATGKVILSRAGGVVAQIDSNGQISCTLAATDDPSLSQTGWGYLVKEYVSSPGYTDAWYLEVPMASPAGTLDLATVARGIVVPAVMAYADINDFNGHVANVTNAHGLPASSTIVVDSDSRLAAFPSSLRRTRLALGKARAGLAIANIAMIGDSNVAGYGLTATAVNAWPQRLASILTTTYAIPSTGSGWVCAANTSATDSRITYGSGWAPYDTYGNVAANSTTANALTFTSTNTGTIVRVCYPRTSTAFSVSIDGGAPVTVTPPGGSGFLTYEVTGLANTTHTVAVVRTGAATATVESFEVRSSATGLRIRNGGISGIQTNILQSTFWYGTTQVSVGSTLFNADCVIIEAGVNDLRAGVSAPTFNTRYADLLTKVRANGAEPIIVTPIPPQVEDLTAYREILHGLAESQSIPILDLTERWGSWAIANGYGVMSDDLHPTAAGHADIAQALAQMIVG